MPGRFHIVWLAAGLLLGACSDDAEGADEPASSATAAAVSSADVSVSELVTGDCISGLVIGAAERTMIDSVRVVDCATVHEVEVFATFDLDPEAFEDLDPTTEYPGEQRVVREADEGCAARLGDLGVDDEFGLIAIWPSDTSWVQGDRGVTCAAFPRGGEPFEGRGLLADDGG